MSEPDEHETSAGKAAAVDRDRSGTAASRLSHSADPVDQMIAASSPQLPVWDRTRLFRFSPYPGVAWLAAQSTRWGRHTLALHAFDLLPGGPVDLPLDDPAEIRVWAEAVDGIRRVQVRYEPVELVSEPVTTEPLGDPLTVEEAVEAVWTHHRWEYSDVRWWSQSVGDLVTLPPDDEKMMEAKARHAASMDSGVRFWPFNLGDRGMGTAPGAYRHPLMWLPWRPRMPEIVLNHRPEYTLALWIEMALLRWWSPETGVWRCVWSTWGETPEQVEPRIKQWLRHELPEGNEFDRYDLPVVTDFDTRKAINNAARDLAPQMELRGASAFGKTRSEIEAGDRVIEASLGLQNRAAAFFKAVDSTTEQMIEESQRWVDRDRQADSPPITPEINAFLQLTSHLGTAWLDTALIRSARVRLAEMNEGESAVIADSLDLISERMRVDLAAEDAHWRGAIDEAFAEISVSSRPELVGPLMQSLKAAYQSRWKAFLDEIEASEDQTEWQGGPLDMHGLNKGFGDVPDGLVTWTIPKPSTVSMVPPVRSRWRRPDPDDPSAWVPGPQGWTGRRPKPVRLAAPHPDFESTPVGFTET